VFTDDIGHHLYKQTVLKQFKRIVANIGIPDTRFHDLRHTYATLALQNGDDIKSVSEALGHATVAFTLDVYGHVTQKMRKDSAARMQAYIETVK
jgi:integrase